MSTNRNIQFLKGYIPCKSIDNMKILDLVVGDIVHIANNYTFYVIEDKTSVEAIPLPNSLFAKPIPNPIAPTSPDSYTVDTIEKLKELRFLKEGNVVEVLGYYQAGDGAGHKRVIADSDDGSGVQLGNGLWANIVHNGEVNVSWFGAKGDGVTDDTQDIQKAITFLSSENGGVINFESKKYIINSGIYFKKSIILKGTTKSRYDFDYGTVLDFKKYTGDYAINIGNDIGQGIENLKIVGTKSIIKGIVLSENTYNNTLRNVDIIGFENGIYHNLSWNNIFEKVTVSECTNGFNFVKGSTSSSFIGCLCYNSDNGFIIEEGMPYSSFISCGTDHVAKGVIIKADLSNTGFYNFGFEDYQVCWELNSPEAFVNINGFYQYKPRYDAYLFNILSLKRLNLYGCDLSDTSGAHLFYINNLSEPTLYGSIRSYGCKFNNIAGSQSRNLDRVIQDGNMPYNFLRKTSIGNKMVKYDGLVKSVSNSNGISIRLDVPNNEDKIELFFKAYGKNICETCSVVIYNNNEVIEITNSPLTNLTFDSWDNSAGDKGKGMVLKGDTEINFEVMAISYNTASIPNISTLKVAYDF